MEEEKKILNACYGYYSEKKKTLFLYDIEGNLLKEIFPEKGKIENIKVMFRPDLYEYLDEKWIGKAKVKKIVIDTYYFKKGENETTIGTPERILKLKDSKRNIIKDYFYSQSSDISQIVKFLERMKEREGKNFLIDLNYLKEHREEINISDLYAEKTEICVLL